MGIAICATMAFVIGLIIYNFITKKNRSKIKIISLIIQIAVIAMFLIVLFMGFFYTPQAIINQFENINQAIEHVRKIMNIMKTVSFVFAILGILNGLFAIGYIIYDIKKMGNKLDLFFLLSSIIGIIFSILLMFIKLMIIG